MLPGVKQIFSLCQHSVLLLEYMHSFCKHWGHVGRKPGPEVGGSFCRTIRYACILSSYSILRSNILIVYKIIFPLSIFIDIRHLL